VILRKKKGEVSTGSSSCRAVVEQSSLSCRKTYLFRLTCLAHASKNIMATKCLLCGSLSYAGAEREKNF